MNFASYLIYFSGKSTIEFEYNTDSSYIVLLAGNNDGFTVTSVTLTGGIELVKWEHYKEKELLIVEKKNEHEIATLWKSNSEVI